MTTEILWTSFFKFADNRYSSYTFRARISWKDYTFGVYGIECYENKKGTHSLESYDPEANTITFVRKEKRINLNLMSRSCKLFRPYTLHETYFLILFSEDCATDSIRGAKSINRNWQSPSWQKISDLLLKSEVRFPNQKDPATGPHQVLAFQALTQCCWCVSHLSALFPPIVHLTYTGGLFKKANRPPTADIKNIRFVII